MPGVERCAARAATGIHRPRCVPMRLLYPGTDLFCRRATRRGQGQECGRDSRTDERQYLPLWRLSQHRCGNSAGDGSAMIGFQYTRAQDVADAIRQMAAAPSAKFIAGGTNLIDL